MAEPVTGDDDYGFNSQLALVNAITPLSHSFSDFDYSPIIHSPPRFSVPDGWTVQHVPRPTGIRVDRYFIEPETGRKFRSRNEVMRYLNDEEYQTTGSRPLGLDYSNKNSTTDRRVITSGGTMTPVRRWSDTKFTVPEDWFVEKVPRKSGRAIDKYYHDPVTGRKFRSLRDVERYLTEGLIPRSRSAPRLKYHEKSCGSKKKIVSGGKMLDFDEDEDKDNGYQLVNVTPTSYRSRSSLNLPDGWIVEYVPRRSSDQIDRYYYEPGTGQKFRSLSAVRRHLAELEENSPLSVVLEDLKENNLPLSKAFKLSTSKKNHGSYDSRKKSVSKTDEASSLNNRPSKINWVMSSSGGESWNAFVNDSLVPDCMQQQWGRRFMFDINNNNHNASISG